MRRISVHTRSPGSSRPARPRNAPSTPAAGGGVDEIALSLLDHVAVVVEKDERVQSQVRRVCSVRIRDGLPVISGAAVGVLDGTCDLDP